MLPKFEQCRLRWGDIIIISRSPNVFAVETAEKDNADLICLGEKKPYRLLQVAIYKSRSQEISFCF